MFKELQITPEMNGRHSTQKEFKENIDFLCSCVKMSVFIGQKSLNLRIRSRYVVVNCF